MTGRGFRLAALSFVVAVAAAASPAWAAPRGAVPHGSGGGHGGAAPHGTATRGGVPPHGTATGTAHYGYGHGGYWGGGYWGSPWWGWYGGYPYWGVGWSVSFGWPYYGYGPYYDGSYYGPTYVYGAAPPSGPAVVETDISPKNADIVLDGQVIGRAKDFNGRWDELHLDPGHHTLAFQSQGYKTLVFEMDAQPGARYVLSDALAAGTGEDHRVIAAPARHEYGASAAPSGEGPPAGAAAATSGVPKGLLRVHVTPDDAGVYLDGEFLGMGSELARLHGAIPVATGEHRLEIVRPGYAADVRTVFVDGKGTSEVTVALTKGN